MKTPTKLDRSKLLGFSLAADLNSKVGEKGGGGGRGTAAPAREARGDQVGLIKNSPMLNAKVGQKPG